MWTPLGLQRRLHENIKLEKKAYLERKENRKTEKSNQVSGIVLVSALALTQSNLWGFLKSVNLLMSINCAYYNIVIHRLRTI